MGIRIEWGRRGIQVVLWTGGIVLACPSYSAEVYDPKISLSRLS